MSKRPPGVRHPEAPIREGQHQFGTSEMARLISRHDWSATPLGPIDEWPEALVTTLSLILRSSFQLAIYWGEEFILLYNDAERVPLQGLHPAALGQPARVVLEDMWPVVGPMLEHVLSTGQSTWSENAPLLVRRGRAAEEAYFTWSYSPILGERGSAEGVLLVSTETTRHVLSERRVRTLHLLGERTSGLRSVDDVWRRSIDALNEDPDLLAAEIHRVDGRPVCVASSGGVEQPRVLTGVGARRIARTASGDLELARGHVGGVPCTVALVPIVAQRQLTSATVLVLGISRFRRVDRAQRAYLELLAGQIRAAEAHAAAYQRERDVTRREATVEERHRIERDLHDTIQRQLVGARLVAELTREVAVEDPTRAGQLLTDLSDQLGSALTELREILEGRYPGALLRRGVVAAIRGAAERARLAIAIEGDELGRLPEPVEQALYFTIAEAMQNAFKHGGPGVRVTIRCRRRRDSVVVSVHDSGSGFDPERATEGAGLRNMRERLEAVSGSCRVRSAIGGGTCVRCESRVDGPRPVDPTSIRG